MSVENKKLYICFYEVLRKCCFLLVYSYLLQDMFGTKCIICNVLSYNMIVMLVS